MIYSFPQPDLVLMPTRCTKGEAKPSSACQFLQFMKIFKVNLHKYMQRTVSYRNIGVLVRVAVPLWMSLQCCKMKNKLE